MSIINEAGSKKHQRGPQKGKGNRRRLIRIQEKATEKYKTLEQNREPWGTKAGTIKAHEAQTQDWGTDVEKADKPTE